MNNGSIVGWEGITHANAVRARRTPPPPPQRGSQRRCDGSAPDLSTLTSTLDVSTAAVSRGSPNSAQRLPDFHYQLSHIKSWHV